MDGLDDKARLELEIIVKGLNESTAGLARFAEGSDEASRATERLRKATRPLEKELGGLASGERSLTAARSTGVQALEKATSAQKSSTTSLIAQRYALYDVATTYGVVSAALLASAGYAIKVGADFESAFTNVQRTMEDGALPEQIQAIRDGLVDLSTQIPLTFQDLAKIASLGNQLNVPADDILGFTETIARFAAVAGISVDQVADSFGKIANLTGLDPTKFENLGSAIAYVARTSAATESTILSTSKEIAAIADGAGFSADAIVGLAGALSSLSIPPERARGALSIYFSTLNKAVAEGGDSLTNFATIVGVTREQLDSMVRTGRGQEVFQGFIQGISQLDNVAKTQALDDLGLSAVRVDQTFQALSSNTKLVSDAFSGSAEAMSKGTELANQYAKVVDDLNSRWMTFVNSVNGLIEALSGGAVTGLAGFLGILTDVVNRAREFADNPIARALTNVALVSSVAVAAYFGLAASTALATASTYALTTAQAGLAASGGSAGLVGMLRVLVPGLFALVGANTAASAATTGLTFATAGTNLALGVTGPVAGRAAVGIAALGTAASAAAAPILLLGTAAIAIGQLASNSYAAAAGVGALNEALDQGAQLTGAEVVTGLIKASTYLDSMADSAGMTAEEFAKLYDGNFFAPSGIQKTIDEIKTADTQMAAIVASGNAQAIADLQLRIGASGIQASKELPQYTAALAKAASVSLSAYAALITTQRTLNPAPLTESVAAVGKAAGGSAKQVKTLADYASDLSKVFDRAFEIRFGSTQGLDLITGGWLNIADATAAANQDISDYRATLLSLTADRSIKEYWLSVAENYGDALRAGELRAELADVDNSLAKTTKDLSKAQDKNSKTLIGNTEGAIDNRAEILGLVGNYQDYIASLASSGLSQDALRQRTAQLKADFMAQATQLGYNNQELQVYAAAFDDVSTAINQIPRNITVSFNGDPAIQALNEFMAQARSIVGGTIAGPTIDDAALKKSARGQSILADISYMVKEERTVTSPSASAAIGSEIRRLTALYNSGNYWKGGYVGDGGKYEPKGIVHGGEFVFSKQATQNIGVSNLAYAHNMAKQGKGFSGGGSVGGAPIPGAGYMQLAPTDRQLLVDIRDAIDNKPVLTAGAVASATSAVAVNQSNRRAA